MKEGPQPPRCSVNDCENPLRDWSDVMCPGHMKYLQQANGSATTPSINQPDDPALIERTARVAAAQEQKELAERRRVKTWKTLENGTRVPDELYSDEEFALLEEEATKMAAAVAQRVGVNAMLRTVEQTRPHPDPVKEAAKLFKWALKGKLGDNAKRMAWSLAHMLEDL